MNRFVDFILKHNQWVIVVTVLLLIPAGYFLLHQRFFNHFDIFFENDDPDLVLYQKFVKTFGSEEIIAVVISDKDIFTPDNISLIRKITHMAKKTGGITNVMSLTEYKSHMANSEEIIFQNIIPEGELSREELATVKESVMKDDILSGRLVSKSGTDTIIVMEMAAFRDNNEKYNTVLEIKKQAQEIAGPDKKIIFTGPPYVECEITRLSQRDFIIFTPIVFVIIFFLVFLLLKSGPLSVICMMSLGVSLLLSLGIFTLCGESFNIVTTSIGPILLVISVADALHLLAHYRDQYNPEKDDPIKIASTVFKRLWLPCLLTSVTTAVGFLSFINSSVRPVKVLGIYTAIGVAVAFVVTVTFLPAALVFSRKIVGWMEQFYGAPVPLVTEKKIERDNLVKFLIWLCYFVTAHYKKIFAGFILLFIVTITGITKVSYETNFINYLPDDNSIKQDILSLQSKFGGTIPFVAVLTAKSPEYDFTHPESLKLLEKIQTDLVAKIEKLTSSFSVADYIKKIHHAFNESQENMNALPQDQMEIQDYYLLSDKKILSKLVSPDKKQATIMFQARWGSNEEAKREGYYVLDYLKENLGEHHTIEFTGLSSLYLKMERRLKQSQISSFLSAFGIIFILMYFVCGTLSLTVISMIPNLIPIYVTMGITGWLNIPLDVSTIMIASITLGIAVDDTTHVIVGLRRYFVSYDKLNTTFLHVFREVGKPAIINALIMSFGFSVLLFGSILPTKIFGALCAFAMVFALMCELFLLPVLVIVFKPKIKPIDDHSVKDVRYRRPSSKRIGSKTSGGEK